MKKCRICGEIKPLEEFDKDGKWYRGKCKECRRKELRTGKPNTGRFKKGHRPDKPFKKGNVSWNKGKKMTPDFCRKAGDANRGRKQTKEEIEKRRQAVIKAWEKKEREHGRRSIKSRKWSKKVIARDGNKCTMCGETERLHAHHIIPWEKSEELRFELSNGITLCPSCHSKDQWKTRERTPWNKGKKLTEEHVQSLRESHLGQKAWNKGLYTAPEKRRKCKICGEAKDKQSFTPNGKYRTRMCKSCRNLKLRRIIYGNK